MKFIYSEVIPKVAKVARGPPHETLAQKTKNRTFCECTLVVLAIARTSRVVLSVKDNLKYYNS